MISYTYICISLLNPLYPGAKSSGVENPGGEGGGGAMGAGAENRYSYGEGGG